MSDQRPADKRPTADERRVAGMRVTPTREEMEQEHQERLETMNNPPQPTPTQEEADAMMEGAYPSEAPPEGETPEAKEAREARRRRRDMKPEAGAEYKTR